MKRTKAIPITLCMGGRSQVTKSKVTRNFRVSHCLKKTNKSHNTYGPQFADKNNTLSN